MGNVLVGPGWSEFIFGQGSLPWSRHRTPKWASHPGDSRRAHSRALHRGARGPASGRKTLSLPPLPAEPFPSFPTFPDRAGSGCAFRGMWGMSGSVPAGVNFFSDEAPCRGADTSPRQARFSLKISAVLTAEPSIAVALVPPQAGNHYRHRYWRRTHSPLSPHSPPWLRPSGRTPRRGRCFRCGRWTCAM